MSGDASGAVPSDPRRATWNAATVEELRTLQSPGDPDVVEELVGTFRDDVAPLLSALLEFAARRELPAVRNLAHRIKGGAANLGADRLARSAGALESGAISNDADAIDALVADVVAECGRFLARAAAR